MRARTEARLSGQGGPKLATQLATDGYAAFAEETDDAAGASAGAPGDLLSL